MNVLTVKHLFKYYPKALPFSMSRFVKGPLTESYDRVTAAINDLNLIIKEGEIFGLLGPNGAGKTTLCKIINALVTPSLGEVRIWGKDPIRDHQYVAQNMISVFGGDTDIFGLFSSRLSCTENLKFAASLWGLSSKEAMPRISDALDLLDLSKYGHQWYQQLSAGNRQKLFLALPMILRRKFVILDEPTIRIDITTRNIIRRIIKETICKDSNSTILLASHDMNEVEQLCDRIGVLNNGKLIFTDTPEALRRQSKIECVISISIKPPIPQDNNTLIDHIRSCLEFPDPSITIQFDQPHLPLDHDRFSKMKITIPTTSMGSYPSTQFLSDLLATLTIKKFTFKDIIIQKPALEEALLEILKSDADTFTGAPNESDKH